MKQHLKRIASPRTWFINRKKIRFIIRPKPSGHPFDLGLPLGVILRDLLGIGSTRAETQKLLYHKSVLVDGVRRKDPRFLVGLFDVLELPDLKKAYRVILDSHGRISLVSAPENEKNFKPCKIIGKKSLSKGRIQFNLHDGKNILLKEKAKVGDSLILTLPKLEVSKVLPLQPGMQVFLTRGKHSGELGELKELRGAEAVYKVDKKEVETAKKYLFVVGDKKAVISFRDNEKSTGKGKEHVNISLPPPAPEKGKDNKA